MNDFASRLNKAMKDRNVSAGMLAIKTGLSERMIRQYQGRAAMPGSYALKEIATSLRVSTDWLLGIKGEETNESKQDD